MCLCCGLKNASYTVAQRLCRQNAASSGEVEVYIVIHSFCHH